MRAKAKNSGPAAPLFRTLKGGLGEMVDAVGAAMRGMCDVRNARVLTVERAGRAFRLNVDGDWFEADHVACACEAHSASSLLRPIDGRLSELLGAVPYSSSMTVALGYDAADLTPPPPGFGFLVPKKERKRLVACTWVGTKFPNRVPEGKIVARCFLGGMDDPAILGESDDGVIAQVTLELREIAGVSARPRFTRIHRWQRSMAQPTVGHPQRVAEIEERCAAIPGLHLAGNAYHGIGIPDCIRMGRTAAEKIGAAG
jgi:oxygen-dependent protoporphyrinogen oxidase